MRTVCITAAVTLGIHLTLSAYVLSGHHWTATEIPYYVNTANQDGMGASSVLAAVQAAAQAWSDVAAVDLVYAGPSTTTGFTLNGKSEIVFVPGSSPTTAHAMAKKYVDSNGVIFEADINLYDVGYRWFGSESGCSNGYYVQDAVTHELGHLLGISHSSINEATMWGTSGYCATWKRTLHADDVAAVSELYGSVPPPASDVYVTVPASVSDDDLVCIERSDGQSGCLTAGALRLQLLGPVDEPEAPPIGGMTLSIVRFALGADGQWRVELDWHGVTSEYVRIYKDGASWKHVLTTRDTGTLWGLESASPGPYAFQVCESGTTICSPVVTGTAGQ